MPLKRLLLIYASVVAACSAASAAPPASEPSGHNGYYRYPSLHGDTVVFTSEGAFLESPCLLNRFEEFAP